MATKYRKIVDSIGRTYYFDKSGRKIPRAQVEAEKAEKRPSKPIPGTSTPQTKEKPVKKTGDAIPKKYYVSFRKGKKLFWKDQDGNPVRAEVVEKSRRKKFAEIQRGDLKGQINFTRPVKKKAPSKPKQSNTYKSFGAFNVGMQGELKNAVEKKHRIFIQKNGKTYEVEKTKANISALLQFFWTVNDAFYKTMRKKTDSPFFNVKIAIDEKNKFTVFNLDILSMDEKKLKRESVKTAFTKFKNQVNKEFKKTFDNE